VTAPFITMKFAMPPAELRQKVAILIALGLSRAHLPYIKSERINHKDLEGVANYVIGGLLGLESAEGKEKGN
jgi:hypothetical protein